MHVDDIVEALQASTLKAEQKTLVVRLPVLNLRSWGAAVPWQRRRWRMPQICRQQPGITRHAGRGAARLCRRPAADIRRREAASLRRNVVSSALAMSVGANPHLPCLLELIFQRNIKRLRKTKSKYQPKDRYYPKLINIWSL